MKCPQEIIVYMHEFLDQEISKEHENELRQHLKGCESCQKYFQELKRTEALVQSTSRITAPADFTQKVMSSLPKEKRNVGARRWFRNHPLVTAASLFILLMGSAMFSTYKQDQNFSVTKQPNLIVQNETVIVPQGKTVEGDIEVHNGDIRIEGKVNGDVTVINGHQYMAAAGNVTGEIEEVDQVFEWLWFKIKHLF
ncbi:zf-HC2 domain-containing protein [Peribacillus sp. SCS-155]|uniref:zf-HC2 domain-containing protein n=1 Tax=Peribacillus sedimenti TaxID=3115297 RepID=UPI0039063E33